MDNVADIVVFLEVLGYNKKNAIENGFDDLYDLAKQVYGFLDYYNSDPMGASLASTVQHPTALEIPRPAERVSKALLFAIPWMASLLVLFTFGVSLWMAFILPLQIVTAMAVGLFLGLGISEGTTQIFTRLLYFYNEQSNESEVNRILNRLVLFQFLLTSLAAASLLAIGIVRHIPAGLVLLSAVTLAMITLQRVGNVILYGLKKGWQLAATYIVALVSFLCAYMFLSKLLPEVTSRYFASLGIAFAVLLISPTYYAWKLSRAGKSKSAQQKNSSSNGNDAPHFFKPPSNNKETIASSFGVQIWENATYALFSTFFFVMLFGDRVISWYANSGQVILGTKLPLLFNSEYHIGADLGLIVLFPSLIVQFVLMEPVYYEFQNLCNLHTTADIPGLNRFLKSRYNRMILYSLASTMTTAAILFIVGPQLIEMTGGGALSLEILYIAIPGNVLLSIFLSNSQFMMVVLNRTLLLTVIAGVCAFVVVAGGLFLSGFGLQGIALAYLISSAIAAASSTLCIRLNRKNLAIAFLAR